MISDELVQKALSIVGSSPANHEYFFANLTSPAWIDPLRKEGRFKNPAQIRRDARGISFPTWPESNYLARMAPHVPELVRDVILEAAPTDNERVHQDYIEAALHMPVRVAADIAKMEARWVRNCKFLYTLYPEKVGDLISHLARGGAVDGAVELARALLAVITDPRQEEPKRDDEGDFQVPREPMAKFDQWHYRRVLEKNLPDLVTAAPDKTLRLLSDLLQVAIQIHSARNSTPEEDYSWIWRPQIAHEHMQDFKEALVSAVRAAALSISVTPESTTKAANMLSERRWRIFRRLAAYLLDNAAAAPIEAIGELLTKPVEYEDFPGSSPEFDQLLAKSFAIVPKVAQETILGIIDRGPNLESFKKGREAEGNPATPEEVSGISDSWRIRWLSRIKQDLSVEWQERYKALVERLGEPPLEGSRVGNHSWVGPTSPKTVEELRELQPDQLIEFLRGWHSKGDWNSPTPEGLGRAFSSMIAREPGRLAIHANLLRGLDPTYVRSAIEGFREAVKEGKTIAWDSILTLGDWIISQPREIAGRTGGAGDSDSDWSWTRAAIARLMHQALQKDTENAFPIEHRQQVWTIISSVLDDPIPSTGHTDQYGKGMFVGSLSLNTPRGIAIDAVVDFGLWVRRRQDPSLSKEVGALSKMPEVQAALEKHLHSDKSAAVREVYGRRFPWLVALDREWATANVAAIFGEAEQGLGQIAWANYILFCNPYDDVLPIMVGQYEHAIDTIGQGFRQDVNDIDQHLAEHLMILYWRGKLPLENPSGLLERYFQKAPARLRGHAIWFVGRTLYDEKSIQPEIIERMKQLWNWRISRAHPKGDEELIQFGYWFASNKFDFKWSMPNLLEVLRLCHHAEPDHLVVQQLAKTAGAMPMESVQALGMLLEGDHEGWSIYGWQEHPRDILTTALRSESSEAREEAKRVINLIGSRGHHGYRDLLRNNS